MQDLVSFAENELSTAEQDFVRAVLKGQRAELKGQRVRASVLRALVTESRPDWVVPFAGISVNDAEI
jgi:hypothetical protein